MKNTYIVVLVTAKNNAQAKKIAQGLLQAKLAACVNIIPQVTSMFIWDGKIDNAKEVLMVIKTKKSLFYKVVLKVQSLHSYSVPEIIALPIVTGEKKYLQWIKDTTCS